MNAPDAKVPSNFYVLGGTVHRGAPCYVERQADSELYEGLTHGQFCYVLTARQIGKSSLMVRTAARLRRDGFGVVVDLTAIGNNLNVEQWYASLLSQVGRGLALEDELMDFWRVTCLEVSPLQRWMTAIRDIVLRRCLGRVVIFVDEIDAVRSLPFSTDEFFAGIREFYNRRSEDPEFERLTFCLLGVATPSDLIRDPRTTPFNIGRRIELHDFTEAEALPLTQGLGRQPIVNTALLKRVLYWTAGHPYLTQRLCHAIAEDSRVNDDHAVDELCSELLLTRRAQEQDDNLLFVRERMLRSEADLAGLLSLYAKMLRHKRVADGDTNPLVSSLRLSGIVRAQDGLLTVRNRIYARVFDLEWTKTNMPDAEVRRQHAAYRRGVFRATAVAAVILVIIAALGLVAYRQRNLAKDRERDYGRLLYIADMGLAQQAYEASDIARVRELLDRHGPKHTQEDVRDFEWYYLMGLSHRSHDFLGHREVVYSVAMSPDGRTLASGSEDKTVRLWDLTSRREISTLNGYETVHAVAFSPDGKSLAAASGETVKLWNVATRQEIPSLGGYTAIVRSVAFSPDGNSLATGSDDGEVKVWDVKRNLLRNTIKGHTNPVSSVMFSPDSRSLVSGSYDHTLKIWDVATAQKRATLLGHTDVVSCAAFSPDGKRLATGSADRSVRVWDVTTHQLFATVNSQVGAVQSLTFFPDGKTLAIAGGDGVLALWDVAMEQELATFKGHNGDIWSVALSRDGKTLATGGSDHTVRLWDTGGEREERAFLAVRGGLKPWTFSPDGRIMVMRSEDQQMLKLRDLVKHQELGTFKLTMSTSTSATVSPQCRILAVGTGDQSVRLWNIVTGEEMPSMKGHSGSISAVAFSPDGQRLATGSLDRTANLWDTATGRTLMTFAGHTGPIDSIAFSPDGRILASGAPRMIKLWDLTTGRELATFSGSWGETWSLAFSPDAKTLAAGLGSRIVKLWDVATRQEIATLRAHASQVMSIAFSGDGRRLATGSADSTVKLWDVASGQPLLTFREHASAVAQVIFSADGTSLGSISLDGIARFRRRSLN